MFGKDSNVYIICHSLSNMLNIGTEVSFLNSQLGLEAYLLSTGDLRSLPDLSTFYCRKVGKFTAINRPIYCGLFTGSRYKKDVNFGA